MGANLCWVSFGEGRVVSLLSWKCRNNFIPPNLHQIPQLHYWIYFPKQHPHPEFWTSITDVLYCLFPEAVKTNLTAVPQSGEGEISSIRREILSPWNRKRDEKYLEDSLIALTSLVTTCQTAQITYDHHGEAPKKGRDVRQNLGGLGGILVCWDWVVLVFFVGFFGGGGWFGF